MSHIKSIDKWVCNDCLKVYEDTDGASRHFESTGHSFSMQAGKSNDYGHTHEDEQSLFQDSYVVYLCFAIPMLFILCTYWMYIKLDAEFGDEMSTSKKVLVSIAGVITAIAAGVAIGNAAVKKRKN